MQGHEPEVHKFPSFIGCLSRKRRRQVIDDSLSQTCVHGPVTSHLLNRKRPLGRRNQTTAATLYLCHRAQGSFMTSSRSRRLLVLYALLMLVIAFGYARYDGYIMDGDGTAFMDISQALTDGHAGLAINGYWNPGYPAVLAAVRMVVHPTRWTEMAMARYTNVAIFGLAILACLFLTTGLVRLRAQRGPGEPGAAVPDWALHLLGLTFLTMSAGRELPLATVRSDTLLMVLLLLAMGLGLRLQAGSGFWAWPVLGATLGCAYLVKSFAFLPSMFLVLAVLIFGLTRKGSERT